ncbi:MAG TPA: VWA domain-containing protein [Vicinamibacterales bacterium]|jgi:Ca-activated chloride channel family protein|nr:VWA domain-containing protein [Vicinamibacterales bacterium]
MALTEHLGALVKRGTRKAFVPVARLATISALFVAVLYGNQTQSGQQTSPETPGANQAFRFKSGVELINVTATVTDSTGRFVSGLQQSDFTVYEDDEQQAVTHFSADRVPVSLGLALDTSQSMEGEKIQSARSAIQQFLTDLSDPQDEFFLYRFSDFPLLLQGWTPDRSLIGRALSQASANGRTALFDTVAEAIPLAQRGQNRKKALVVISDGNDTSSRKTMSEVHRLIRESEALVYAVGIDCGAEGTRRSPRSWQLQRGPFPPMPFPFPPGGGRGRWPPPPLPPPTSGRDWVRGCSDPVDSAALREMTDDSGGRTEIIRDPRDLNPSTANIADELSKQYYLGYPSTGKKDGRWHSIRVEVRDRNYRVRARRGYMAS